MHTRRNPQGELRPLDNELERTIQKSKNTQRRVVTSQEESVCVGESESARVHQEEHVLVEIEEEKEEEEEEEEEEEQVVIQIPMAQTIRALSNPVEGGAAPLCITYPNPGNGLTAEIELKSGFLHHLPKFHGLNNEDPNYHLKEFEFICGSMCPKAADPNILRMKAFPFSLEGKARTWLFELESNTINTWERMKAKFLTKYFPASKVTILRKKISGIQQSSDETFYTYWERFKALAAACPNHGYREDALLTYFYEGLDPSERSLLDAAAQGSFLDKTPADAKELLAQRALNCQQYEGANSTRDGIKVNSNSALEKKVNEISTMLAQMMQTNQGVPMAQVCGVCSIQGHPTDQCPQLIQNGGWETLNAIDIQGNHGGQRYNPFSNTYNPGLKDHPNFRWSNNDNVLNPQQQGQPFSRPSGLYTRPQVPQTFGPINSSKVNYDDILKSLAQGQQSLTNVTEALATGQKSHSIELTDIKKQLGQVVDFMGKIHETGKLPSQTEPNPIIEHAKAMETRSGKVLQDLSKSQKKSQVTLINNENIEARQNGLEADPATSKAETQPPKNSEVSKGNNVNSENLVNTNKFARVPFPNRFAKTKKDESDKAILEIFKKVEVNMPLIECLKQVPKYAKFLKDLCTTRRQTREKEVVKLNETVSAILQRKLPPKLKDPGSFSVPCVIGSTRFENVMLDLGASINVMPYSIYQSLGLGALKKDKVIIQLADRSNKHPLGYVEDVLVQVNELIFPADFYILDMEDSPMESTPMLLGRPFMRTARTKIDVYEGSLTMEFEGEIINFNIFEAMEEPSNTYLHFYPSTSFD